MHTFASAYRLNIKKQVEQLLDYYGYTVVKNAKEAKKLFKEMGLNTKNLSEETEQKFEVEGEKNGDWQSEITVTVNGHYVDSGSDDYFYSVDVTEN